MNLKSQAKVVLEVDLIASCLCDSIAIPTSNHIELDGVSIQEWNDPLKVNSLAFRGNSLEGVFKFKNVEKLELFESKFQYSAELNSLKQVKHLVLRKKEVIGEIDFTFLNRLRKLEIYYSALGNEILPLHLGKCLEIVRMNGNASDVDLNQIDFNQFQCLDEFHINNSFGKVNGFPQNLQNGDLKSFRLINVKMNASEDSLYQIYRK